MVNENQISKQRQDEFQRDVENTLVQGAEVALQAAKEGLIRDEKGRQMYLVLPSEAGTFGVTVDIAYSIVHKQVKGLIALAEANGMELAIMESLSDSRQWKLEVRMINDLVTVEGMER